jgi:monoamine oxidase
MRGRLSALAHCTMRASNSNPEIVIIGAGAAGLAAAAELAASQCSVSILEARDRIGGRVLTRRDPELAIPLELGAEFIHGQSQPVMDWLHKGKQPYADATRTRWRLANGKLQPADGAFEEMKRGLSSVKRPSKDLPFGAFLEKIASRELSPASQAFARMLVEGFDAADTQRVSTLAILDEWGGDGAADAPTFRPLKGFGSLIGTIASNLPPDRVQVELNSVVHSIKWQRGRVRVQGTRLGMPFEVQARKAIVTLPLGVLQSPSHTPGGVTFRPALTEKYAALDQLASGPVTKVVLKFHTAFWQDLDGGKYRDAAFFQAPDCVFPTFWASLPVRSSIMVAWTAGPTAARLTGMQTHEILNTALESLQTVFGARARIREQLAGAYSHDWQADPFSRGAYSYVIAGGGGARKALAQPLENTLFFAGEAAEYEGEAATVSGSLQSGKRAAQQALHNHRSPRSTRRRRK